MRSRSFDEFFEIAVGFAPFPFQRRFAEAPSHPQLVHVPTGLGKTAMAVVGWLWRRFGGNEERRTATPRRLAYCLPMRVLVEQTADNAREWIKNLKAAGGLKGDSPAVRVLMGGEDEDVWDIHPEREAILVGTQDMLLSRALNRGYAASRARWPMQFGMLHTDCLWVFDEIQLMGAGLATTAQLEAFRLLLGSKDGHGCQSVWMSATMQRGWLRTVDFAPWVGDLRSLDLGDEDRKCEEVKTRWKAGKALAKSRAAMGDVERLATEILGAHRPGTRTTVVVNTVRRACDLHDKLTRRWGSQEHPRLVLLHSRFRPGDRQRAVHQALSPPPPEGTIVISTQVIEAGVDVSATTLFTEVAPWASLVQRFGRCNRRGEDNHARIFWLDLPDNKDAEKIALPYELDDLKTSAERLMKLSDVGLESLPTVELPYQHTHVLRRKDLIDLFDTTPDLAGNEMDIDRFVREVQESDVRVFWRDYIETPNEDDAREAEAAPRTEELCPAPIGEFREFSTKQRGKVWRWNFPEKEWEPAHREKIVPGHVLLVNVDAGGYSAERGWDPKSKDRVEPIEPAGGATGETPEGTDDERLSRTGVWQTIAVHAGEVCAELDGIVRAIPVTSVEVEALHHAARWHDRGKAHNVFQAALPDGDRDAATIWAKAPRRGWKRYKRKHFRHELASALAVLDPSNNKIPDPLRDLVAYLVAAHHGKVRLSIRSLPNESRPAGALRFARGVWDGDALPETDLGGGVIAPKAVVSLEPMELGLCEELPFEGEGSWLDRMIRLRDRYGPFRLAFLEALLRAADQRASEKTSRKDTGA